ncbi:MAG TPA: T9SS type A sorting domain-containing protein [Bacteroidia bacterium]|nr:T9SS type A sorting domain-containing protein [Bacteroidia bacterium]
MKTKIYLITAITLFSAFSAFAQDSIPNHHFERWDSTATWEEPKLWTSLNSFTQGIGSGVSQVQYPGTSSYQVSIKTIDFLGNIIPGLLVNGDFTFSMSDTSKMPLLGGTPYSSFENKLYGLYNYVTTDTTDSASVIVALKRWDSANQQPITVSMGSIHLPYTEPGMHPFEIDIEQLSFINPDSLVITILSTNESDFKAGGELTVDFVSFDKPASIEAIENNMAVSLYPNPSNNYIYVAADDAFTYTITDVSGKTVITGEGEPAGVVVGTAELTPGVYFIRVHNENGNGVARFVKQ